MRGSQGPSQMPIDQRTLPSVRRRRRALAASASHFLTLTATSQADGGPPSRTIKLPLVEFAAGFSREEKPGALD
jgi:hypothetical protein